MHKFLKRTLDTCDEIWPAVGNLFGGFRLFGDIIVSKVRELRDLRMTDGLMTLVDEVNLKGASLLAKEVLVLEAEGARERS